MRLSVLALPILLGTAPLAAQQDSATINGTVIDSLGQRLRGVTVLVNGSIRGIRTDSTGAFRVGNLRTGLYELAFQRAGFAPRTFRFMLNDEQLVGMAIGQIILRAAGGDSVAVVGTVTDSVTGDPVPAVSVGLQGRIMALTEQDGAFRVANVELGTVKLEARRIGYHPIAVYLDVAEGGTLNLDVKLAPLPFRLEDINVEVDEDYETFGQLRGLLQRRKSGQGYSFLRWEIEQQRPHLVTDLFRTLPGVRVRYDQFGNQRIFIRGCGTPTVYINGFEMDDEWRLDEMVLPDGVEAVEVHLGAYSPPEYHNYAGCGLIALWTR